MRCVAFDFTLSVMCLIKVPVCTCCRYANNENYPKALEDFQQALKLNPKHQNAADYFIQTLHAYARE